jgi:hypothetical protein
VEGPVRIGRLTLTRNDLRAPLLPLWSLADRLHSASIQGAAPATREIREVGFLPRSCLLARLPGPGGGPVVLRLPAVPLGAALRGHVGLVGDPPRGAPPVSLRVKVDGVELGRSEASAAPPAWRPFTVDTSRLPPILHEVTVELAPSGPLPLGVCVDLAALP